MEVTRPRLVMVAVWTVLAAALGGGLAAAHALQGPLDDTDMAYERPGFLDPGDASFVAPQVVPGHPARGERAVVFFVRSEMLEQVLRSLAADRTLTGLAQPLVVVATAVPHASVPDLPVVGDPMGWLAAAFRMRVPRDGGPPVGYAIVDRELRVRYRTLDPGAVARLNEVDTLVDATP